MVRDVDARRLLATTFYADLLGWVPRFSPMPGFDCTTSHNGSIDCAGLLAIPPDLRDLFPRWMTYFTVEEADEATREEEVLGGTLGVPLQDVPGSADSAGARRFWGSRSP